MPISQRIVAALVVAAAFSSPTPARADLIIRTSSPSIVSNTLVRYSDQGEFLFEYANADGSLAMYEESVTSFLIGQDGYLYATGNSLGAMSLYRFDAQTGVSQGVLWTSPINPYRLLPCGNDCGLIGMFPEAHFGRIGGAGGYGGYDGGAAVSADGFYYAIGNSDNFAKTGANSSLEYQSSSPAIVRYDLGAPSKPAVVIAALPENEFFSIELSEGSGEYLDLFSTSPGGAAYRLDLSNPLLPGKDNFLSLNYVNRLLPAIGPLPDDVVGVPPGSQLTEVIGPADPLRYDLGPDGRRYRMQSAPASPQDPSPDRIGVERFDEQSGQWFQLIDLAPLGDHFNSRTSLTFDTQGRLLVIGTDFAPDQYATGAQNVNSIFRFDLATGVLEETLLQQVMPPFTSQNPHSTAFRGAIYIGAVPEPGSLALVCILGTAFLMVGVRKQSGSVG